MHPVIQRTLKPLCPTRWTVRTAAIDSVVTNYSVLQAALDDVQQGTDEYALKAVGYLNSMEKFSTYFGLKLGHLIFSATEQLSLNLQAKDTTIQEAIQASNLALQYIQRQRSDEAFDSFYHRVVDESKDLTYPPALPRNRRHQANIFTSPKHYFRQLYFEVLDTVAGELRHRFQHDRGLPVAAALENLLLCATRLSAADISLPSELEIYSQDVDLRKLTVQLKMVPDLIRTFNAAHPDRSLKEVTSLRTFSDILNAMPSSKVMLDEVARLLQIVLTIPVTTATAERTFSVLRCLKTFLRSTMSQP